MAATDSSNSMWDTVDQALVQQVKAEVESYRSELIALCTALVAAESVNPPGRTAGMAHVVCAYLEANALPAEIVAADEEAPNVVSRLDTGKPGRHVVFNAHMDTMLPGDEAAWSVPILKLQKEGGRLYGLGMGNMKGALAAMALAMKIIKRRLPQLGGVVSLTAVSDEVMFGNRGTPYLLERNPDLYGDYMISGEGPGWMDFAVAEKGLLWVDITARGDTGHSSRALAGTTAPARLASFISKLDELNGTYIQIPPEIVGIDGGPDNVGLRLSASVGTLEAGAVRSLMAPVAKARADLRLPPGLSIESLKAKILAMAIDCPGISVEFVKGWSASWAPLDHPLVRCMAASAELVRGKKTRYVVRLPGSDARYWRDKGIASVCYGPQPTLSSGVDDYAEEQDVLDCATIYALAAMRLMCQG